MQAIAEPVYSCYRTDYRAADRCASSAVLSASDEWIYPNYTVSPQAAYSRVTLPSMYSQQRPPDQNYPSPSPSVPSPGPRMSPTQLEYSSQSTPSTPPGADFSSSRDAQLGPVRHPRTRQLSLSYKQSHGRRHSVSDSQIGECDLDDTSRPQSPHDAYRPELVHPGAGLSLSIPLANMDATAQMNSPYQPPTPASLSSHSNSHSHSQSPYPYTNDYRGSTSYDGRPPSPAPSSGSGSDLPPMLPHGQRPIKKHTKKKLDAFEKKKICMYHLKHQNARQEDIAEQFGIERSTVSKILKAKNQWLNVDDNAEVVSKNRPSKFPELEGVMRKFLQECIDKDINITDSLIRNRALDVAKSQSITEDRFKASAGWIENFKHRHGIRSGKWHNGVKTADQVLPTTPQYTYPRGYTISEISPNNQYGPQPKVPEDDDDDVCRNPYGEPIPPFERRFGDFWAERRPRDTSPSRDIVAYHAAGEHHVPGVTYVPGETLPIPTAEEAMEGFGTFWRWLQAESPIEEMFTPKESQFITTIATALFQRGNGMPFTRS
ncbi:hypothetical protein D9611_008764 [Ephemerocybe angulata]|uniref:HTH CENPB-type domain-containing protein n=1 Tax=Ephemerocybe angulata TaxID=980116 RepID=A0A8H5CCT5_9AGAR|nr:hypothetical protein D9611_008764 [Tulosesus angulatus]